MGGRFSYKRLTEYRFTVGTKVLCRTGEKEWSAGEIVALNYAEPGWDRSVPYQVQLEDDSRLIFVPADVEQLCRKLVPPWWANVFDGKPENYFAENPSADVIRSELDSSGKNVNERDHQGRSALMRAAQLNWNSGVSALVELKADVNLRTQEKTHALHFAVQHGDEAMMKTLIDAKADLNCQENDPDFDPEFTSKTFGNRIEHRTPLHIASLSGDAATTSLLLTAGAKIDIPDAQYKTALHLAIDEKQFEVIDLLLLHKADVNLGNRESGMKNSPLMDAAHKQDLQLVKMLLTAKAAVNQQGKQEMSALHLAARKGDAQVVQVLLESSADINQKCQIGTVEQLARKNGGSELLKVLGFAESGVAAQIINSKELYLE